MNDDILINAFSQLQESNPLARVTVDRLPSNHALMTQLIEILRSKGVGEEHLISETLHERLLNLRKRGRLSAPYRQRSRFTPSRENSSPPRS